MREIELTQGYVAMVDDEDYDLVSQYKWHIDKNRSNINYAKCSYRANGKINTLYMHRLIMGDIPKKMVIDHVDGDGLDNRRYNLRIVSVRENNSNHAAINNIISSFSGVFWDKRCGRFRARVDVSGRQFDIGWFRNEADAYTAYIGTRRIVDVLLQENRSTAGEASEWSLQA